MMDKIREFFGWLMAKFSELLGLPPLASDHGAGVDALIIYIHWLMIALFIGWVAYFGYVLFRFSQKRNPRADYIGVRSHASNYIELLVAGVEAVLLIFFAVPLWAKTVDKFPAEKDSTTVHIVAQQFQWNARYPGQDKIFGKQDMRWVNETDTFGVDPTDPAGKDDVQVVSLIHVVVNKPVILYINSKDVIHSFKVIAMRVTQDAIPGMRIPMHFKPTKTGIYQINCAQLCGVGHSAMSGGRLIVETQGEFDKWLAEQKPVGSGAAGGFD